MNNLTTRTVLTSQFSDYEQPRQTDGYLQDWINKLKDKGDHQYRLREERSTSQIRIDKGMDAHTRFSGLEAGKNTEAISYSSANWAIDKENICMNVKRSVMTDKNKEKPFVAAMKALQAKVKLLESQKASLKEQLDSREDSIRNTQSQVFQKLSRMTDRYELIVVANNEYKIKIAVLESTLEDMDRLKTDNYRNAEQIRRLERNIRQGELMEESFSSRYAQVLRDLENKSTTLSHLKFQNCRLNQELAVSKSEIKVIRTKLLNCQYRQEDQRTKTTSNNNDILKAYQEVTSQNQKLVSQLQKVNTESKNTQLAYLSQIQRLQSSLQSTKKQNEVMKEKTKQMQSQINYFKDSLSQKQNTLLELCKTREYTTHKQQSLREISSAKPQSYCGQRIQSKEVRDFNDSEMNTRVSEEHATQVFLNRSRNKSLDVGRKRPQCGPSKKSPRGKKERSQGRQTVVSRRQSICKQKRQHTSEQSKTMPFQNQFIKAKADTIQCYLSQTGCQAQQSRLNQPRPVAQFQENGRQLNRVLLMQAEKEGIRLLESHLSILQGAKNCISATERGQFFGRLKQLSVQIKANNEKTCRLKQQF